MTEDEAKACSGFVWVCKEKTAAPSDNHGQEKLGGTVAQMDFHLCQLYSKKKIGLSTESATQLYPALLLDKCCFAKPVSKATPQKQRLQKKSCTAKSWFSKWEHLITPQRGKVSLFFLPAPLGAWGREGPLSPSSGEQGEGSGLQRLSSSVTLQHIPEGNFPIWEHCRRHSAANPGGTLDCEPNAQQPSFAS